MNALLIDPIKLAEAVQFAAQAHLRQTRRRATTDPRPRIPYISHLIGVAGIVIEDGGDTDQAIAGLLHDYLEDVNGTQRGTLVDKFGGGVAEIVVDCTGPKKEDIKDFRERKQHYLNHLRGVDRAASVRVSLADKVHNARSTVNDLEADGPAMWDRFNAGVVDQLWWYSKLALAYQEHATAGRADRARVDEFARLVERMKTLSA
jgi:(p)ppGpp synthase/HD superfamily hydrolase